MAEDRPDYQHEMRLWEIQMERQAHLFGIHLAAVCDFASLAIKSIILANSAAAGAVLAFLATMWGDPDVGAVATPALKSVTVFAVGVFAAMVCGALSYLAQYSYAMCDWSADDWTWRVTAYRLGFALHILAVLAAAAGIATFAVGASEGLEALEAAKGGLGTQAHQPVMH